MKRRLSRWKTPLLVATILVSTLTVMAFDLQGTQGTTWLETVVITALAPFQKAITRSVQRVQNLWHRYVDLVGVRAESDTLRRQLASLQAENTRLLEENLRLRRLQKLQAAYSESQQPVALASVVGHDTSPWSQVLLLDRGKDHGVERRMVVVSAQGLVGQIIEAGPQLSKVLLLTDFRHAVDALIQRTRDRGVVVGYDRKRCLMKYIPRDADVRPGDRVISSGMGGIFPKGLLIGTVVEVSPGPGDLYQEALVKPSADLARLEEVFILAAR
jgi:rod shape-determining protein MreC